MIIKGTFDMNAVLAKAAKNPRVHTHLKQKAREKFQRAKNEVIKNFKESEVTREISAGESSSNISSTLGGYGNLYSYIGFYAGANPLDGITSYLENFNFVGKLTKTILGRTTITQSYSIKWFNIKTIEALSSMPWESGNSWIRGIEKGISGFSYYMYGEFVKSRSGKGKQSKKEVDNVAMFTVTRYLPTFIEEARQKFK